MRVEFINLFEDNYSYLIIDEETNKGIVVDPADASVVIDVIQKSGVELVMILTTHHHWDHAGGNEDISTSFPDVPIIGGSEKVKAVTQIVSDSDELTFGNAKITCYHTPCHTTDHILYHFQADKVQWLFTGDTLFLGGCGKFFEGDGAQMYHALLEVIASLPGETLIYCGHEYSASNLKFAKHIDPENEALQLKLSWCEQQRESSLRTVPSTITEELSYNPFMRVSSPTIKSAVGQPSDDDTTTMTALREYKNQYRPN